jgi:hypothetical protein
MCTHCPYSSYLLVPEACPLLLQTGQAIEERGQALGNTRVERKRPTDVRVGILTLRARQ